VKFRQKLTIITIHCLIQVNMNKVVIKILQHSVVTHTVLGGLTKYPLVVNFL